MADRAAAASIEDPLGPNPVGGSPMLLTVTETAQLLRISRNLCYELVAQGRLPHIRLRGRIRVPRYGLEQWIAQESGTPAPPASVLSFRTLSH
jgi:excisionase family DNA binding protein